jgi:hypothetical protein
MDILLKFMITFAVGAFLLFVLSFTVYRKSYYYKKAMAEAGVSDEKPRRRSQLVTLAMLLVMILFFVLFDLWITPAHAYTFLLLSAINLGLIALLSLYDALFIDLFVLLIWRPSFLHLPKGQPTRASMMHHIKMQFTRGWIFIVPMALAAAALATFTS